MIGVMFDHCLFDFHQSLTPAKQRRRARRIIRCKLTPHDSEGQIQDQ